MATTAHRMSRADKIKIAVLVAIVAAIPLYACSAHPLYRSDEGPATKSKNPS